MRSYRSNSLRVCNVGSAMRDSVAHMGQRRIASLPYRKQEPVCDAIVELFRSDVGSLLGHGAFHQQHQHDERHAQRGA